MFFIRLIFNLLRNCIPYNYCHIPILKSHCTQVGENKNNLNVTQLGFTFKTVYINSFNPTIRQYVVLKKKRFCFGRGIRMVHFQTYRRHVRVSDPWFVGCISYPYIFADTLTTPICTLLILQTAALIKAITDVAINFKRVQLWFIL